MLTEPDYSYTFTFGQYKHWDIEEVFSFNRNYLIWLVLSNPDVVDQYHMYNDKYVPRKYKEAVIPALMILNYNGIYL